MSVCNEFDTCTDTDGDSIGDEWEDLWFGNNNGSATPGELAVVDETTDFDSDGVSDLLEFIFALGGYDPTDGTSSLPVGGGAGLLLLTLGIGAFGWRHAKRMHR